MVWELEDLAVKKLQHSMWACICEFDSSLEEPAKHVPVKMYFVAAIKIESLSALYSAFENGPIKSNEQDWM